MGPSVEFDKLRDFILANSSYTLEEKGENVEVHFSPDFPEARAHLPDNQPVEHVMYGERENGKVYFHRFTTFSSFGETSTELEDEDDAIMEWLKYI